LCYFRPCGEDGVGFEPAGIAREVGEDGLGDFLGELRGTDLPERGGINQVQVAVCERGKGFFGFVPRVVLQQFQVASHRFQIYRHRMQESDKIS
jgi:hypothetical protein